MKVVIILHTNGAECVVFDNIPSECPPLPSPGDVVECKGHTVILEGRQYVYRDDGDLEIRLLA